MQEISNVYLYTAIPSFTLASSLLIDYHSTLKLMALAAESLAVTGALTQLAKASVRRFRPRAYPESDLALSSKLRKDQTNSFFSGHSSAISASCGFTAKVFSDYFPESKYKPLVWASMLSIGAAGSWLRVEAGAHFPSDTLLGFAVGFASSWGVLEPHRNNSVAIIADPSQDKIGLEYRLNF
jgi:membrane-associated phospholipid phosphatase